MNNSQRSEPHILPALASAGRALLILTAMMLFTPAVNASEAAERGEKSYQQFCQGCHGGDKAGVANFTGGLEDLLAILDGETNQMPDFYGVFSEDEVAEIFAFLQTKD